ncbi:DBH-like monooxygenase protein 2 homolog isoform 2-T3 [Syngnathus typhle]
MGLSVLATCSYFNQMTIEVMDNEFQGAQASDPDLPFMDYLDNDHLVCIKWGFDDEQGNITIKFIVNTTGWVGFGLSPNGDMRGADLIMGGLGPGGIYFKDYYATGNGYPVEDQQQSYTLLSLEESDGQTLVTFSRPFQTCDDQDLPITAQAMNLIYAYGNTDEISYHGPLTGTKELNLLNYVSRATAVANGNSIRATVENVTIPPQDTYYHCRIMKLPTLIGKHHIIRFEPVIENPDVVHHMLLYNCPPSVTTPYDGECYLDRLGALCHAIVAAWALGGQIFDFPEDAGIPIGGSDNSAFYRLEIHYNNPNNESGRTDSSGLKLHYTDQLRPHDVGILSTGVSPSGLINYDIPPGATKFRTFGVCNTSLFSQIMEPVPDLQVFAIMMHTHLAGREVRVGHFRNGEQLGFLASNPNYDFNLQEITRLGSIKTIKPGDVIVVECSYSTSNRTKPTKMGFATTDEMCLAFLLYYPKIEIVTCISWPNISSDLNQQFPSGGSLSNQQEIVAYENLVKNMSQIQIVYTKDYQLGINRHGHVGDMMETPTFRCEHTGNASSKCTSRIWHQAAVLLVVLWMALF